MHKCGVTKHEGFTPRSSQDRYAVSVRKKVFVKENFKVWFEVSTNNSFNNVLSVASMFNFFLTGSWYQGRGIYESDTILEMISKRI